MSDEERALLVAVARALAALIENTPVMPGMRTIGSEYDELVRATIALTGKA